MPRNNSKPVFILGVGAQKAGTTWLSTQLRKNNAVNLGFAKEYHIWDAVYLHQCRDFKATSGKDQSPKEALRGLMQTTDGVYEAYFRQLIDGPCNITGDLTPSYSMLSSDHFTEIRAKMENAGFEVRVIFLMREPVNRVWSAMRMHQRNQERKGVKITDQELVEFFSGNYKGPWAEKRTRYDQTISALRESFDPSNLHFDFYERLFDKEAVEKISDFIGQEMEFVDFDQKVNVSKPAPIPAHIASKCREYYIDVYNFCHAEFPETRSLWGPDQ